MNIELVINDELLSRVEKFADSHSLNISQSLSFIISEFFYQNRFTHLFISMMDLSDKGLYDSSSMTDNLIKLSELISLNNT